MIFATLVEEGLRRLRNTSPSLLPTLRQELMSEFNTWMMAGGHKEVFRIKVTEKVLDKYQTLVDDEKDYIRFMYRDKAAIGTHRLRNNNSRTKSGWFKNKGFKAVLRVQKTPGSRLANSIKKRRDDDLKKMKILI